MKTIETIRRLPRAAWVLPLFLLCGCPSGQDSHADHDHESGQEHGDSHEGESAGEHEGHDHDQEDSK